MSLEAKIEALTAAVANLTQVIVKIEAAGMQGNAPSATPAPAPTGVPFNDAKGLMAYVMVSYQTLGPQKCAQIQTVLSGLGVQNINDVKPEQYAALYNGIEQLKGAA